MQTQVVLSVLLADTNYSAILMIDALDEVRSDE